MYYTQDDKPGPGSYVKLTQAENTSPSFSKKGTGGFASKVTMNVCTVFLTLSLCGTFLFSYIYVVAIAASV